MYALFDIGGTTTRVAFSRDGITLLKEPILFPTEKSFPLEAEKITRLVHEHAGTKLTAAAAGVPGALNGERAKLIFAPHLPLWAGASIKEELQNLLETKVFLENDAALAGLGEAIYGAGRKHEIVAYITVSTGVGGARVVRGRIDDKALAFEPGHQIIAGKDKKFEELISGTAIEAKYGKHPSQIFDDTIWEYVEDALAQGLYNATLFWSPHVFVLGGSMVLKTPGIRVQNVEKNLHELLKLFSKKPAVLSAQLGDKAGLFGALVHARTNTRHTHL